MIRVNLLGVERKTKKARAIAFDLGQTATLGGSLILVATVLGVGWWFWSLRGESLRVDAELVAAQQESARLQSLLGEVEQFEQQRTRLQQRVALIEQLRSGQSIPVQLLDHVSRSVPDMLWLTSMVQEANQVTIEGRATSLIALSDFVGNLAGSPILQKPIEIVNSQVQPAAGTGAQATPDLIQFTVRAKINTPPQAAAPAGRGGRGARGGAARGRQGAPL
jgi:type IV pilus assembly protein PilN